MRLLLGFALCTIVAATDVAIIEVDAVGTVSSTSLLNAGVSDGFVNYNILLGLSAFTTTKIDSGYVIKLEPPASLYAYSLATPLSTCAFREVLELAWSAQSVGLSNVSIVQVCTATAASTVCPVNYPTQLIDCDLAAPHTPDSGSGDVGSDDAGSDDDGEEVGASAIAAFVITGLAATFLILVLIVGNLFSGGGASSASLPTTAALIPLVVNKN